MSGIAIKYNNWLGSHMFLVVLSALILGFVLKFPDSPLMRTLNIALFSYATFITALSTSFKSFVKVLAKPWVALWILFLIHFIAPFIAWGIGCIFFPDNYDVRLGYLVSASVPIGVTSLIWIAVVGGHVPTSLVAITADTLLVPVFLPVFFKFVIGQTFKIDYLNMAVQLLLMITLPSLAGMLLHDLENKKLLDFARSWGGLSSKAAFFAVIFINASIVAPEISWDAAVLKLLAVSLVIVAFGYLLGYLGSFALTSRSHDMTLSMIYNVGMRNFSFGLVLAMTYFPPAAALPITLSMLYQQPIAGLISHFYKKRQPGNQK